MLFIGDKIFYPGYGAGTVINIEEREVYESINKYYIIKLVNEIITMVPVDTRKGKGIRKCVSEEECKEILGIFKSSPKEISGKWLDRYKIYTKTIKEGNVYDMANLLNNIIDLRKQKKMSKSEEKFFEDLLQMVSEEISIVLNTGIKNIKVSIMNEEDSVIN